MGGGVSGSGGRGILRVGSRKSSFGGSPGLVPQPLLDKGVETSLFTFPPNRSERFSEGRKEKYSVTREGHLRI